MVSVMLCYPPLFLEYSFGGSSGLYSDHLIESLLCCVLFPCLHLLPFKNYVRILLDFAAHLSADTWLSQI